LGFTKIVLPKKNISAALKVPKDVTLIGIENIYQALANMKLRKQGSEDQNEN
jgi:predicted pyridoxine 5'-phosphate oxidase superfamily flavin-nucleotide-binding protein